MSGRRNLSEQKNRTRRVLVTDSAGEGERVAIEATINRSSSVVAAEVGLWSASLSDMIMETLFGETDDRH